MYETQRRCGVMQQQNLAPKCDVMNTSSSSSSAAVRCMSAVPAFFDCGCYVTDDVILSARCIDRLERPDRVIEVELRDGQLLPVCSPDDDVRGPPERKWACCMRPARDVCEQNVQLVLDRTQRCLRLSTTRTISAGDELFVWYSEELALELGVPVITPANINGNQSQYVCTHCTTCFRFPNSLKSHVMHACRRRQPEVVYGANSNWSPCQFSLPATKSVQNSPIRVSERIFFPAEFAHTGNSNGVVMAGAGSAYWRPMEASIMATVARSKPMSEWTTWSPPAAAAAAAAWWNSAGWPNYFPTQTGSAQPFPKSRGLTFLSPVFQSQSKMRLSQPEVDCLFPVDRRSKSSASSSSSVADDSGAIVGRLFPVVPVGDACRSESPSTTTKYEPNLYEKNATICDVDDMSGSPNRTDKVGSRRRAEPAGKVSSSDGGAGSAASRGTVHRCVHCGKLYSRRYGLTIHLRTHSGLKPLHCHVCRRPFGDPSNLNKHVRLHADGDSPYRCRHCGKVLVRRRDLERHVRSRHPGESVVVLATA